MSAFTFYNQSDVSCLPDTIDRLEKAIAKQRPDLSAWFTQTKAAHVDTRLATNADMVIVLDTLVRGLQRAGAGPVIKSTLSMKACPTAYMTAVRLGTIMPDQ